MTAHLAELLSVAASRAGDRCALVEAGTGRRLTWRELEAEVDRLAEGLNAQGLVAGYRVAIALGNRTEFVTTYLAVLRARLVAVPLNPRSATGELLRVLADSGARLVVCDATTAPGVRDAVRGLGEAVAGGDAALRARSVVPTVVVVGEGPQPGELSYDGLHAAHAPSLPGPTDPEALAVLLYTSGTSGQPRAAMLSHRALVANVEQAARIDPPMVTGDDVVLGLVPLFHVYGLNAVLGQVMRQGARLVLLDGFDVEESLAVVEREQVSVLPVAPAVLSAWLRVADLQARLGSARLVLSGSAALPKELSQSFREATGLEVHEGYGLTEAAPVVTSTLCTGRRKPGSVGTALPGISVRLVDDSGRAPDGGDPGEIVLAGENLFGGYWPDGADGPDGSGWYATGDLGLLDEDGDLFLVDRLKELVVVSGFHVYPREVEEVIEEVAGVAEAAVIAAPHPETGEAVIAYVRPEPGSSLSAEELGEEVQDYLPGPAGPLQAAPAGRGHQGSSAHRDRQGVQGQAACGARATRERALRLSSDGSDGSDGSGPEPPRVVVYTKPGCHLCEAAMVVVTAVCRDRQATWREVDISGDSALMSRHGEEIPVTFVDGVQHDFWRVDPDRLHAALR